MRKIFSFIVCGFLFAPLTMHAQDYDPAAVAVINTLIANNGLNATPDAPASWSFAQWDNTTPRQLISLSFYYYIALSGEVSFAGLTTLQTLICLGNNLTKLDGKAKTVKVVKNGELVRSTKINADD